MKKIIILYFSGTGATKKVAELMREKISRSCGVEMFSVEDKDIPDIGGYDAIVIGTPTYHAAPARAITQYFDALPRLDKKAPAFVFNTRGMASLNTNRLLAKKLRRKNIITIMDRQYRSPASDGALIAPFIRRFFKFEKDIEHKVGRDCRRFIGLLDKGEWTGYIPRFSLGSIINAPNKLAGQLLAIKIHLHKDKCAKCGQCAKKCPHRAISADREGYPEYSSKNCENCYRCVHHCPHMALSLSKYRTPRRLLRY